MNLSVHTACERLMAAEMPAMAPVSSIPFDVGDLLLACGGFEDRALGVVEDALAQSAGIRVILIDYEPPFIENKGGRMYDMCLAAGVEIRRVVYNRQDPSGFGDRLLDAIGLAAGRITIDVSAMSRILVVQVVVALSARERGLRGCAVAYCEARDYPPTAAEAEARCATTASDVTIPIGFLSSGVFDITVLPELASAAPVGTQTRLVCFPSLDTHHLASLLAELQPSRVSSIEGVPPDAANRWRQQLIAGINGLDKLPIAERLESSTLDYRETLSLLGRIYVRHATRERIVIAPTGSKMQAVAVGLFRAWVHDVQVVYPTPIGFRRPDSYTHGIGRRFVLHLDALTPGVV